jgi:hypothetical protein
MNESHCEYKMEMWNEAVMPHFSRSANHFPEETEEHYENNSQDSRGPN